MFNKNRFHNNYAIGLYYLIFNLLVVKLCNRERSGFVRICNELVHRMYDFEQWEEVNGEGE